MRNPWKVESPKAPIKMDVKNPSEAEEEAALKAEKRKLLDIQPEEEIKEEAPKPIIVEEKEAASIALIHSEGSFVRPWVDEKLKEIGCEFID